MDYFTPLYSHLPLPFYPPVSNASVLLLFRFFILLLLFECIIVLYGTGQRTVTVFYVCIYILFCMLNVALPGYSFW